MIETDRIGVICHGQALVGAVKARQIIALRPDGRELEDVVADGLVVHRIRARHHQAGGHQRVRKHLADGLVQHLVLDGPGGRHLGRLLGAGQRLDFEVIGVFQSFSKDFDARAVRIPLQAARELMDTDAAHVVVVTLEKTEDTDTVLVVLKNRLEPQGFELAGWRELSDFYDKTIKLYGRQFGVLRLIILLMVLLSVTNSVNMTLFERTREFGTMLALGDRPSTVFRLIMTENALLGMSGAVLGVIVGSVVALVISLVGIPMPPPPNANVGYTAFIRLVPLDVVAAGAIGMAATILAAILPARRSAQLVVVDALRQGV